VEKLKIVATILGDDVARLTKKIQDMRFEGAKAVAEVARLETSKLQADSFDVVEETDRKIAKLRWTIARAADQLPKLEQELKSATDVVRAARLAELRRTHDAAFRECILKCAPAFEAYEALIGARARLESEGFAGELRFLTPLPHLNGNLILSPELMQIAVDQQGRSDVRFAKYRFPTGARRVLWVHETSPAALGQNNGRVCLAPNVPARAGKAEPKAYEPPQMAAHRPPRKRVPDDVAPLAPDEVRVVVLHSGFSPADDAPQCATGQKIRMKRDDASLAALSGAIEILSEEAPPLIAPAETALTVEVVPGA
jgi:hypothetical protein